jgi:hypothetical protein
VYPFFVSGVKVVWDQARSSMFVMLQTFEETSWTPHLYIIKLDAGLKILNAVRYDQVSSEFFHVSDMLTTAAPYMSPAPMSMKGSGSYFME